MHPVHRAIGFLLAHLKIAQPEAIKEIKAVEQDLEQFFSEVAADLNLTPKGDTQQPEGSTQPPATN